MERLRNADEAIIRGLRKIELPLARFAIFTIYFWFGFLKVLDMSPAGPLVGTLFDQTIHFMTFGMFYFVFALFEVIIGMTFMIKGLERLAILLVCLHLITTMLPLFILPQFLLRLVLP